MSERNKKYWAQRDEQLGLMRQLGAIEAEPVAGEPR